MKLTKMHQYREYEIIEARSNPRHPRHKMPVAVGIRCPKCGTSNENMKYESSQPCIFCGVTLERKGTILQYTEESINNE